MRILVEQSDTGLAWATERALRRRGWEVGLCPGPERLEGGCPLLEEGRCTAVEGADAIPFALPLSEEQHRSILRAHGANRAERPVLAQATGPKAEEHRDALRDVTLLREPVFTSTIVDALEEALPPVPGPSP